MNSNAIGFIKDGCHIQTNINISRVNLTLFALIILSLCVSCLVQAANSDSDFQYAPVSFQDENTTFVPVDISQQNVFWSVSDDLSSVQARSETIFSIQERGSPFLLLNPSTTGALVSNSGKEPFEIKKMTASPFSKSNFYYIDKVLEPGTYVVQFQYSFIPDLKMSSFLPIQYNAHAFGEAGIPSNYVYDHFKLTLDITINSQTSNKYQLITNGSVTTGDKPNTFHAQYPSHFTSMSFFIDIVEISKVIESKFEETSIGSNKVDVLIYGTWSEVAVQAYKELIDWEFNEIEKVFGPYPYSYIILKTFGAESPTNLAGAFAGAMLMPIDYTMEIFHELGHSWYMQNISPAQGDDMWLYEGIGMWAPSYLPAGKENREPQFNQYIDLSANPYSLSSTKYMHDVGPAILSEIHSQLQCKGGLLKYLKKIYEFKMRDGGIHNRTLSTKEFKLLLEELSGENLDEIFSYYFKNF
ncbi:hypothetical protein [Brumicola pallidula]|uniref:Peptidase M1 membrane alanine aminopeptidase domain-containing protein n=1 Tax=Brumicola pallidula DSM 14239 = ACAM 615 TaxID=1121922 RepID=K6Y889_9ALTE|nr:hypothetical protein [Glaciecola pallidula]GAC28974.1 hypothetical protein GPAL_2113 [Glaciecola pallidula DSM 14239 = ACAM 615]